MKKKFTSLVLVLLVGVFGVMAQPCTDWIEYVDSKNVGDTSFYELVYGESAAQIYNYTGKGKVLQVRIDGSVPDPAPFDDNLDLRVSVYNVVNGMITDEMAFRSVQWGWGEETQLVSITSSGVYVEDTFAIVVKVMGPSDAVFNLNYTGDGEGLNENLSYYKAAGGGAVWESLLNDQSKDGDFYLYPRMQHYNYAAFEVDDHCVGTGETVSFTNLTGNNLGFMFNKKTTVYEWDFGDGQTSTDEDPTHIYATPGAYTVTLISMVDGWDSKCEDTATAVISVGLNVTEMMGYHTDIDCEGTNLGSIKVEGSGGLPPYMYKLNSGDWQISQMFTGLHAGSYTVSVKDSLDCMYSSGTQIVILQPDPIEINYSVINTLCGSNNGEIHATAKESGNETNYWYKLGTGTYQQPGDFTGLNAGIYTLWVKDNSTSCEKSFSITISNTGSEGPPLLTCVHEQDVTCYGYNNGSIELMVTGGEGPFLFSIDGTNWQEGNEFTGLAPGTYTPAVEDIHGCIYELKCPCQCQKNSYNPCPIIITQPDPITFSVEPTDVSCNGGSDGKLLIYNVEGGKPGYTYKVNGISQSNPLFTGFSAGDYTVYVKDVLQCEVSKSAHIDQPNLLNVVVTKNNLTCNAEMDGEIHLNVTGGTAPYTFEFEDEPPFTTSGDADFMSLAAGTYYITVTDAKGCCKIVSATLTQPNAITATVSTTNSTCGLSNGTMLITGAGGSGSGYVYRIVQLDISNGTGYFTGLASGNYDVEVIDGSCTKTFEVNIIDFDGPSITSASYTDVTCRDGHDGTITISIVTGGTGTIYYSLWKDNMNVRPNQLSNKFTGLDAGEYTVVVRDSYCSSDTVFTLLEPEAWVINLDKTDITCHGGANGTITIVSVTGGAGILEYKINGFPYLDKKVFTGLTAGSYTVWVRDEAGCEASKTIMLDQPTAIDINYSAPLDNPCYGDNLGQIFATATGGTGTLMFKLESMYPIYQANGIFTNLPADDYMLWVKDALGCEVYEPITITEPDELMVSKEITQVSCKNGTDGSINLTVTGGVEPYTYEWSNGKVTEDIFNLFTDTIYVTITDNNGCMLMDSSFVPEPEIHIFINHTVTNASSATAEDGTVNIFIGGGTPPYTYMWSTGVTTQDLTESPSGRYSVTITDANGCMDDREFTINDPTNRFLVSGIGTDVTCFGGSNGVIDLDVSGGVPPYTFEWSNGSTTEDQFNLLPGDYDVTVTDDMGYMSYYSFTIAEGAPQIVVTGVETDASSISSTDGACDITVSGGTPPYTYSWSNGAVTEDITNVSPNVYSVLVVDANGCFVIKGFTVGFATAVDEIDLESFVNVYPNPADEMINIELGESYDLIENITIVDITGKVVYQDKPQSNKAEINTKAYATGVYSARIQTTDKLITKMIVIKR